LSLLATAADFEPANPNEGATALYYQPHDGSGYRIDFEHFAQRNAYLTGRFPPAGQTLAIWGCGFGALVDLAVQGGYAAYGFDASSYAVNRGTTLIPAVAAHLFVRDALVSTSVTSSRRDAGLKGAAKFALLVTEDMLTCMSDSEITTTLPLLRGSCSTVLLHIVTPLEPGGTQDARLNWKTVGDWKTLVAPDDVYDAVAGAVA
jgi:hypothetical protein